MNSLLWTSAATFAAALLLTAVVRAIARRCNVVDRPDGSRKLHGRPVPLWGGVAVYTATVLGLLAARLGSADNTALAELSNAWIIAAGFVCLVGGVDDHFSLPSRIKLALQTVAVLPIIALGYHVDRIVAFGYPIVLGWLGIPLTILWLLGCINALNLIDGMDGLASLIGLSTASLLGVIAASQQQGHVAAMAIILAASLAGFLIYNLPPASIFLGDSGSMVIGLSIGLLGMQGSLKTSATLAITAPVVVMTLPMFDIVAAIVRRTLNGRPIDMPDRQHIHHRLLDRGWSPWQVLWLLGALCLTTGAAATAATIFRLDALAWIAAMSLVVLMIRLRLFGHYEFAMLKEVVVRAARSAMAAWLRIVGRLRFAGPTRTTSSLDALIDRAEHESEASNLELWDLLLRGLGARNVYQVVFSSPQRDKPRRIRWINPRARAGQRCHWSLSVSLPDGNGEICELSAAALDPVAQDEVAALRSLLTAYATRFAVNTEEFFGPAVRFDEPTFVEPYPSQERKAA